MNNDLGDLEVRELLERGVAGAAEPDLDLVEGVWRRAGRRRRGRRLVAGSAVAAAAAVVVSQLGGGPEDLAPAESTQPSPSVSEPTPDPRSAEDQLEANRHFLHGIRTSGLDVDYEPMESPEWAVTRSGQALVGEVLAVREAGGGFVVTVGVRQRIPDAFGEAQIDIGLSSGTDHGLTEADLDAVGGPVVAVLPVMRSDAPTPEVFYPYTDGFWLDVPDGVGNPHVDWAEMAPAWPQVDSVADLAGVLTAALPVAEPLPDVQCSASYQNPPFVRETGLSTAAFETADAIFGAAGSCDHDALIARATADGTVVAVGDGDLEEQLAIPDPNGAYLGLAGTLTAQATTSADGELHTFDANGWRVVIDRHGRWVEFSSGHVTYPVNPVAVSGAWDAAPRLEEGASVWRRWAAGAGPGEVGVEPAQGPCCLAVDGDRLVLVDVTNQRFTYDDGSGAEQVVGLPVALRGVLAVELVGDSLILAGTRDGAVWTAHYSVATGTPQLVAITDHPGSPALQERDQLAVDGEGRVWFHELTGAAADDWVRVDDPRQRRAHRPLPDGSALEIVHEATSVRLVHRTVEGGAERAWVVDRAVGVEDADLVGGAVLIVFADADRAAVVRLTPDGGEVLGTVARPGEPFVGGPWRWRSAESLLFLRATDDVVEVLDLGVG